jgi:hypothetical protein
VVPVIPHRQVEHECVKGAQRHQAVEIGVHFQQVSVSVVFEEGKPQFLNRDATDIQQNTRTIKQIVHIPMPERALGTGQRPYQRHQPQVQVFKAKSMRISAAARAWRAGPLPHTASPTTK